ncbi:SDR family NAD(P)-dependent oxidoreductase [Sphaerisporangium aureirubrum]|uniref:SDR family NAD(P)-dependent oxidoreductase n=1 Tax=Sphaerisporangium aureirubrum TaxID=1544736 RepID=A0ABW1NJN4_9ACTN
MRSTRLAGARVLITGASSGIGAATARAMAPTGARLLLTGRDRTRLAAVAAETGARALVCDLTAPDAAARATAPAPGHAEVAGSAGVVEAHGVAGLVAAAGTVDVLVANAGAGWAGAFTAMPPQELERLVVLNLTVPMLLTRLLLPGMIESGRGHVVLVASIAGAVGVRDEAVYSAAKAGLLVFAESLRHELRGPGAPGVSVVLPGVVDTPFFARRGAPYARRHPAPIPAERVARAVVAAVERGRPESYVPAWLRLPARLRGAAPGPFRLLARRAGGSAGPQRP